MKKLVFIFFISICTISSIAQTNFRSVLVDTGSVLVNYGFTEIKNINITNLSTPILYVKLYNKATKPYAIDTPVITYQLGSNALTKSNPSHLIGWTFSSGLWVRCTTGSTDTSTATPITKPIIELRY